jgi:hypothetical protein
MIGMVGMAAVMMVSARQEPVQSSIAMGVAQAASAPEAGTPLGPEDLLEEAELYDREADQIQAEVMEYKRKAAAITPLADTKGIRRSGLLTAAASRSKAVAELRQLAAHHRAEASRMMAGGRPQ